VSHKTSEGGSAVSILLNVLHVATSACVIYLSHHFFFHSAAVEVHIVSHIVLFMSAEKNTE